MTLIGLYFMYLKIKEKQSFFYVLRRTAWGFYGVLIAACCINWDVFITRYNIQTPVKTDVIDVRFLLTDISAKNLPLILENKDLLKRNLPQTIETKKPLTAEIFDITLENKIQAFIKEQSPYSWLSFNFSDRTIEQYLKDKNLMK